ncbi:MAG TPA: thiol reductase thioredoxin [Candidatus Cloacimonetes bacterium]|nr:thiol reductase thioredoxin [Candidatus Cloacimonadota bacterium]
MGLFKKIFNKPPKPGKPKDISDELFESEVLKSEIPSVVDFSSITCPPCKIMASLLSEIGPEYAGKVNIFKMNIDYFVETARKYRITNVPTTIFFKDGKEVDRIVGLLPLNPLKEKFDNLME